MAKRHYNLESRAYGLQNETKQYLRRLYAHGRELAPADVADIDNFVKRLKQLNLWGQTLCWPMRSIHNIGTGSLVLGLGGLGRYDGTMVNSPTWGNDGVVFSAIASQSITGLVPMPDTPFDISILGKRIDNSGALNANWEWVSLTGPNIKSFSRRPYQTGSSGLGFSGVGYTASVTGETLPADTVLYRASQSNQNSSSINFYQNATLLTKTLGAIANWNIGSKSLTRWRVNASLIFELSSIIVTSKVTENHYIYNLYKTTIGKGLGLP